MAQRQVGSTQAEFVEFQTIRTVAGSADASFSFGTRASRPASGAAGDRYLATDIGAIGGWLYYWTGTAWEIVMGWASGTDAVRAAITVSAVDNGAWFYASDTQKFWEVAGGAWTDRTPPTGASSAAQFVTLATDAGLTNERVLTGTANQITVTDGGAGGNVTLSTPQSIHTGATPTFAGMISSASGRFSLKVTTPAQLTADANDYAPGTGGFFRITTDASRNITGIAAGADGDVIYLRNAGSFNFVLTNQDGASTAANRIITGTGASVTYVPDETALLIYDITTARWVLIV